MSRLRFLMSQAVARLYREKLGAKVSRAKRLRKHGVTVVFVEVGNTRIELLEPLGPNSPIAAFLDRNPAGGMHHVCYEVDDIGAACRRLVREGARSWAMARRGSGRMGGRSFF